jgi:hypothetical protein
VDRVRDAIFERARAFGWPVDELATAAGDATTSGPAPICVLISEDESGAFFECDLGDIPPGGSASAVGTFTPVIPGRYFSFAFVQGDSDCAEGALEGGTACEISSVAAATMAPATSTAGLIALTMGLVAVGSLAIRNRRRRR